LFHASNVTVADIAGGQQARLSVEHLPQTASVILLGFLIAHRQMLSPTSTTSNLDKQ
jgi:hypothetical protein